MNRDLNYKVAETVFLALPHGISNEYVKLYYDNIQIIDLSADFRLNDFNIYEKNYSEKHSAKFIKSFQYGLLRFIKV